ncbi:MAG: FkbM family methyltransferase [Chloroflexota bacterium]
MNTLQQQWRQHLSWLKANKPARWLRHPLKSFSHRDRGKEVARIAESGQPVRHKATLFWGDTMIVTPPEQSSNDLYRKGFFEEGVTSSLIEYLKPGMIFIDIGAHYGYFSILASRLVGDPGCVYAFEPVPKTFDILLQNVQHLANVYAIQKAVFSGRQSLVLRDYGEIYSGFNSFTVPRHPHVKNLQYHEVTVEAISIDGFIKEHDLHPDFIKIDAESAEMEILKGMTATLCQIRPIISLEVGDEMDVGVPSKNLISYVMSKEYDAFSYNGSEFHHHEFKERYRYDNILFLPR